VVDRGGVEARRGVRLLIEARDGEPADDQDYYDQQLVGLAVATAAGVAVGTVAEVMHLPGHDLLAVRGDDSGTGADVLIPFVREIVSEIDLAAGRLVVTPPPGLLDPAEAEVAEPEAGQDRPDDRGAMRLDVITIFPEYLSPLGVSLIGKARESGVLDLHVHDLRSWTTDLHHTVDDTPYGGGPGMVMKCQPWATALEDLTSAGGAAPPRLIVPTPSGRPFTQRRAMELSQEHWLIFACGRYEGIDARFVDEARSRLAVEELSIGDYVLAGGEAAALVIIEAITRLLPGVLGNADSVVDDSFAPGRMDGLLEGPVYTKPADWRGRLVPPVLLSGHHAAVVRWRRTEAIRRTAENRPDLIQRLDSGALDATDLQVLADLGWQSRDGRLVRAP
jgi:tRNA (guanine37-N1)-methyltransferase